MNPSAEELIRRLAKLKIKNYNRLNKIKRQFANQHKVSMLKNAELLNFYKRLVAENRLKPNAALEQLLRKRKIRTLSGVAPIAVLTKPYPCPGRCVYCPTEKLMPKSYLSNEPAVMRAVRTKFDPYKQVDCRLSALADNGHPTDKIELIVMGGTWSCLPKKYQRWFIKRCFDACNGKTASNLSEAQKRNEKAANRIIGLTLETRPDYVDEEEIQRWRALGATKVELGVQSLDDEILKQNKRGHDVAEIVRASKLCKQTGFKIAYHIMPNLPGSTPAKDLRTIKKLFDDPRFQPDMLKIYPTVVTKNSPLYRQWKAGKYQPYTDKQLFKLLLKIKQQIPPYVRLIRLIRDIPKESIVAGNTISNLREELQATLKKSNQTCRCIRCREAREDVKNLKDARMSITKYRASDGEEYFLEFASKDKKNLFAFLRLRLPDKKERNFIPEIQNCAMIREVHTYGRLIPLKKTKEKAVQHVGFGKHLVRTAEKIAAARGFQKIAIISGIGVRGFYRKLGFKRAGTYMIKKCKTKNVKLKNTDKVQN
ncbi:tRNA uridine(34) 5-carboxymethylaminomethyl modification radical SAM/GNAT enzyme Elp3 [Candidatus Falkowbacteria bacterium]|nr:tRNA uridine(34) 5-carboxymethylaminomethyl modification radical SAM/GNAT enzyme Elp3 [Candidatus Falkowbacteria bacterium]